MIVPKTGMRMVKTAVAVFLCLLIDFLRHGTPFYSCIAAILCMQKDVENSVKVGINRMVGTLIGGGFGIVVLEALSHFARSELARAAVISLCIIPLIHLTLLAKKPTATYITCVVFLSVTISHRQDAAAWLFGVNRIIDTLIGIGVSLLINLLPGRAQEDEE